MVNQLLTQIDDCLQGLITLRYLEEWLSSHLQDILSSGDKKAIELANRVDADLVELSEEIIDEPTTYEHLQKYLLDGQTEFTTYGQAGCPVLSCIRIRRIIVAKKSIAKTTRKSPLEVRHSEIVKQFQTTFGPLPDNTSLPE